MNKGILFMLISSVSFAVVNTCVKFLNEIPVQELVFFRSLISFVINLYLIKRLSLPFFGVNKKWLFARGIFGTIALTLFFITLKNIPLASAVTIQYISPVFTVIISIFLLKEFVLPIRWLFFLVAFIGIICIKGFDSRVSFLFLGMGLLSALFSGVAYNSIKMCRDTDHPINIVMYFPLVSLPIMGVWCLFDWKQPEGWDWILLLVIGIFTQIAQLYMTKALHLTSSVLIMPFKYIGAVFAIFIGYFIFDENLNWLSYLGMGLVISAVLFNTYLGILKKKKRLSHPVKQP